VNEQLTAALTERLRAEAGADPLTALLLEQMVAASAENDETEILKARLGRAQHALDRVRADLVAANTMAEWVAGVLGACPACWGLDRFCRRCSGAGVPGSSAPDLDQLVPWIVPALRRAGLVIAPAASENNAGPTHVEGVQNGRA
jgi:hypothetical protein